MATQAERSGATREKLLDAAIDALIERGHAGASLPEICRRAGVSRGAQLHHFPTRADLLSAAVEHLFERRHAELRAAAGEIRKGELLEPLWRAYTSGPLYAWLELVVASRVDPTLRAALVRVDERFEAGAAQTLVRILGPRSEPEARVAARLVLSLFGGLATHGLLKDDDAEAKAVLALALRTVFPALLRPAP